jgi:DNA helicase IV
VTYHDRPAGLGIKPFGTKGGDPATRRILFDRKLLMHATNTIAAIVYKISNVKTDMSLRRASTTPLENRFGQTRIRAGVHQTVSAIVKIMEIDEAVKFLYSQRAVQNRRLEYGKIVSPLEYIKGLWFSCPHLCQITPLRC